MAVRIEKGGWILIFLIGLGLVAYHDWLALLKQKVGIGQKDGNVTTAV